MKHLKENKKHFQLEVQGKIDDYIDQMKQDGVEGMEIELRILCKLRGFNAIVI